MVLAAGDILHGPDHAHGFVLLVSYYESPVEYVTIASIASDKTGAIVNDYTAAPVYFSDASNGAHEWLIEFEKEPGNLSDFTTELDSALKNINSDYEAKRHKDIALRLPLIHALKRGTFNEWLRRKGKLGGQHKVPRLSNERNYLDEILGMA